MAEASKEFMKQLRKDVKNNASNWKVLQLLDRTYEEGFRQGVIHCTEQLKGQINAANQELSSSNHDDGVGNEPISAELGGSEGSHAADPSGGEGSHADLPAAADAGLDGPSV